MTKLTKNDFTVYKLPPKRISKLQLYIRLQNFLTFPDIKWLEKWPFRSYLYICITITLPLN